MVKLGLARTSRRLRRGARIFLEARTGVLTILAVAAVASMSTAQAQRSRDAERMEIALAGDLIGPVHPMNRSTDKAFAEVAELFRRADVGFANQENSVFDLKSFGGYPAAENGGGQPLRYASHAHELKDMGVSLASVANNHATDFGSEGLAATLKNLSDAEVVAGGAGFSDTAARGPVYLDTPKGSVALVATTSTFPPMAVAGPGIERHDMLSKPRPGVSPLHVRKIRLLPPEQFDEVRAAAGPLAISEGQDFRISDQLFRRGEKAGMHWEMQPSDEKAILDAVAEARSRATLVIFSIHAHETGGDEETSILPFNSLLLEHANEASSPNDPRPTNFETDLFHAAIDDGADIVARHGPHVTGGIEIYKGRPIFYGLGSLFLDFQGHKTLPTPSGETIAVPDTWFDSIVAVCDFQGHQLSRITLHPIALEPDAGDRSGSPSLAHGERARKILERLRTLSAAFGTRIDIQGDEGVLQVSANAPRQ